MIFNRETVSNISEGKKEDEWAEIKQEYEKYHGVTTRSWVSTPLCVIF